MNSTSSSSSPSAANGLVVEGHLVPGPAVVELRPARSHDQRLEPVRDRPTAVAKYIIGRDAPRRPAFCDHPPCQGGELAPGRGHLVAGRGERALPVPDDPLGLRGQRQPVDTLTDHGRLHRSVAQLLAELGLIQVGREVDQSTVAGHLRQLPGPPSHRDVRPGAVRERVDVTPAPVDEVDVDPSLVLEVLQLGMEALGSPPRVEDGDRRTGERWFTSRPAVARSGEGEPRRSPPVTRARSLRSDTDRS